MSDSLHQDKALNLARLCWRAVYLLLLAGLFVTPMPQPATAVPLDLLLYAPMIQKLDLIPVGVLNIANPSFEADTYIDLNDPAPCHYTGYTDYFYGNQHPSGWTFSSPAPGETMFSPLKWDNGVQVPTISDGEGEYVHKCWWQLPADEWLGEPRGLILEGDWAYKTFGFYKQQALKFSQVITGTPGTWARVTAYILGEENGQPPPLEYDHFVASVKLGDIEDKRPWAVMVTHYDVPGNTRNWNKFVVATQFPASGELTLEIYMQQNWQTLTDFFIDNISGELLVSP